MLVNFMLYDRVSIGKARILMFNGKDSITERHQRALLTSRYTEICTAQNQLGLVVALLEDLQDVWRRLFFFFSCQKTSVKSSPRLLACSLISGVSDNGGSRLWVQNQRILLVNNLEHLPWTAFQISGAQG